MNLTVKEKETVTKLLEAGTVRSTDLLGKMSSTEWGVMSSSIKEMSVVRVLSWFARSKEKHISVRFRSGSSVPLEFLILFSDVSARAVTAAVTKPFASRMKDIPNLIHMTIGEVANIMAQSVLGVLADEYDVSIILSVPDVREGGKAELLSKALESYDGREDVFLMSHVDMYSENLAAECSMVVMANAGSLRKVLNSKPAE